MTELRAYQSDVLADVAQAVAAGARRILLVAPTGAGKTIIASSIIEAAQYKGEHILVLAHTREIIKQTSAKLFDNGIEHGIIQAGYTIHRYHKKCIARVSADLGDVSLNDPMGLAVNFLSTSARCRRRQAIRRDNLLNPIQTR